MAPQRKWISPVLNWHLWTAPTLLSLLLVFLSFYSFLAFHTIAELFAIIISFSVFAFALSTNSLSRNSFLLFLACGFFWIGALDLMHTLVYKGIDIIVEGSGNLSVQFWIGTRYMEALLMLAAPFMAGRIRNALLPFAVFGVGSVVLTYLIFTGNFPTGFVEGAGLTPFKIYSEYVIIAILCLALVAVLRYGEKIPAEEKTIISLAIVTTMFAELAFTYYVSVYGLSNLAGHIFKLFSYWFIFYAVVMSNLRKPFFDLEAMKNYNRRLFETISVGLALCKMDGTLVDVNPAYAKILGRTVDETLGLRFWDITPPKYHADDQYQIERLNSVGEFGPFVKEYIRKDGSLVPVQLSGKIIELNGEQLIWSFVEDITERDVLEAQLRQAQKMEAVGQLTGGIAHDFNNLLAIMLGNAELLTDRIAGDKEAERDIEALSRAIDRAGALTARLLAFSRQQTLSPRVANVGDLIDGLTGMLRSTLGETIDLRIDTAIDVWPTLIDANQFENALLNLAINARDAMPQGGTLIISTANITLDESEVARGEAVAPGDYVQVTVRDTGTGISPENLAKVFDPFFTTKGVGEGSGLGLSMVYGFVKQSRGHIAVDSEPGLGTTLDIFMPRSAKAAAKGAENVPKQAFTQGSGRILIVEDDENVRKIPANILREEGYEIVEAENGHRAINCLSDGTPFDLLFTDIILPGGMCGTDIAEHAKRLQPNIKILFTSGYARETAVQKGFLDPEVNLINKPYRRDKLLAKVRELLNRDTSAFVSDLPRYLSSRN